MGKTSHNPAPPTTLIAEFYTWSGNDNTVRFTKGRLERTGATYSISSAAREEVTALDGQRELRVPFNRLVLYPDGAGSVPLVVDVLPDFGNDHSEIRIKDRGRRAEITFAVRSVFYRRSDREAVKFKLELQFNGARDFKKFSSDDLQHDELIDNYNPPLSQVLIGPDQSLDRTDEPRISDTLGLKIQSSLITGQITFVQRRFVRPGQTLPTPFFVIEFLATLPNDGSAVGQLLRGFNTSFITNRYNRGRLPRHPDFPDADELISFDTQPPPLLNGYQRVSDELTPDPPAKRRTGWVVVLERIPAANAVNVWNQVAQGFHDSLRTVRAGNKISFLPSLSTVTGVEPPTWAAGYFLRDAIDTKVTHYIVEGNKSCDPGNAIRQCAKYTAFSVWPYTDGKLRAEFPGAFDESRTKLSAVINVARLLESTYRSFQKNPTLRLNLLEALNLARTGSIRIGAIDLTLGEWREIPEANRADANFFHIEIKRDLPGADFDDERFELPSLPGQENVTPPEARLLNINLQAYVVNIENVQPGGQDAPAGNEFIDPTRIPDDDPTHAFDRSLPVVLPWRGQSTTDVGRLFLRINEQSDPDHTDSLSIQLRNLKLVEATQDQFQKLVVIDPDPFSIVAVKFPPFNSQGIRNQSNTIGIWVNGPNGARWQLQSLSEDFSLVLPPQILGEEMQKHHTIFPGQGINFRLSQPTTIQLNQSEFPQNFREPPWNLRRILEPEGAQASGVKITFMQYELLYGLSCSFKTSETNIKNLRLMEIFRRFGRIPGPVPQRADEHKLPADDPVRVWRELYRQYRARIGVFTPWEPANEQSLILNEGVQCVLRRPVDGANLAHPVETDDFGAPSDHRYRDLRGGATWGFESRNVFTAVTRPNPTTGRIESNTARLVDPEFSSLGGWGHVKATFDNNRSAIYGDASMGRTYSYTLERIGRIGCFWNRAKHVIVYERHVAPSRQFVCTQEVDDKFTGLPLLRKTSEYIEILEPARTYPENPLAPRMQRGFVNGCYFTEGQRINVDSQWGGDIDKTGWKVPLWNPAARRDVYPKPVFTLGLESDTTDKDAKSHCECDNPENVFFYTNTEPNLDADTNNWPAVEGVDYVDIPLPAPAVGEYPQGNLTPVFAADPQVAPGFSPCTFRIAKPPSPINIVAERAEKPMSTVLQNVSLMRAAARQLTDQAASGSLQQLNRNISNVYAEIFKKLPETAAEATEQLKDRLKAEVTNQTNTIINIRREIQEAQRDVERFIAKFVTRVLDRENQILDTMGQRLTSFVHDMRDEYKGIVDVLVIRPQPGTNIAEAVRRMFQKNVDALFMVPLSSNILRRAIAPLLDGATNLKTTYDQQYQELRRSVEALGNIGAAERRRLLETIDRIDPQVRTLILSLRTVLDTLRSQVPEPWIPDPQQVRAKIQTALTLLEAYEQRLTELRQAVSQLDKAHILAQIDLLLELARNALTTPIDDLKRLIGASDEIRDAIRARLTAWIGDEALRRCQEVITQAGNDVNALRQSVDRVNEILSDAEVAARVTEFKNIIKSNEAKITALAAGYTAHLLSDIDRLLERFAVDRLRSDIDTLVQNAQSAFNDLSQVRQGVLDQANRIFEDNYKQLNELRGNAAQAFQVADKGLRLIRAFGSPPAVPNLAFDRPEVAFFYKEAQRFVDITPVLGRVNQAQQGIDALKALGVRLPTRQLLEDLVPQPLEDFDLRKIFPDFSGLKLDNLFPGLKMPSTANDRVRVSHGLDAQTRRAWVQAVIDNVEITTPSTLFAIGPVELSVQKSNFTALTRFEAGIGEAPKRQIKAEIKGDWQVKLGGQSMIVFRETRLTFDDAEGLKFHIQPSKIQLNGVLNFISDLLASFGGKDSGLKLGLLPDGGIQCVLLLPLPPLQFGAFGISNLNLGALLALRLDDPAVGGGFSIELGFNLGRKLAPFAVTIFLLGGGGYLEVSTRYAPATGKLRCFVSMGIVAGASLAISLGPIHGGVYIYFGITAEFEAGGGSRFAIGVMLLMRGEVSLLGIVSACITLLLEAQYDTTSGQLIGRGRLSISIEICWCFTLEINEEVTYTVGQGNQSSGRLQGDSASFVAGNGDRKHLASFLPPPAPTHQSLVKDYVNMLA